MKYKRQFSNNKGADIDRIEIKFTDGKTIMFNKYFYGDGNVYKYKIWYSTFDIEPFIPLIDESTTIVLIS